MEQEKICEKFNVSEYTACKAKDLRDMALPELRKGHSLNENVITLVKNFYQSDEYSRVMSGSKDKVAYQKKYTCKKTVVKKFE